MPSAKSIVRREANQSIVEWDWPAHVHPVLRQVYARRAITSPADLDLVLGGLVPVGSFDVLTDAVELLLQHRDARIVVVGDFDSDGATSVALMLLCLRKFGFADVQFFIPDRFNMGYGLSTAAVEHLAQLNPALLVTVDNGVSSVAGVAAARELGIDVLITDHHLPPEQLPAANVLVNPNLPGQEFKGQNLAGVGVAFYLLAALGRALGDSAGIAEYLDLVALGTVADLVPLDQQNRILVQQGLLRIRGGRCRPGIRALCELSGVELHRVTASTLGYQLGPRLNAAGRLDDMSIGVRCLIEESDQAALELARQLDTLNRSRREMETEMRAEALDLVESLSLDARVDEQSVLSLMRDNWHEGLVGLIASRVKERHGLPVFAFAPSGDGLKGSGRSVAGFHLRDALAEVDALQPGLIKKYGGHAMAAGLSIEADALPAFAAAIDAVGAKRLSADQRLQKLLSDGELAGDLMTIEVAEAIRAAGPWGQSFPEPLFDGVFTIADWRWLKDLHLKMTLQPVDGGTRVEAIAFNSEFCEPATGSKVRACYQLGVNEYFSEPRVQLIVEHLENI